jgi:hypothetical protein
MFTLGNWIAFGILMVMGVLITIIIGSESYNATGWIISGLVSIIAIGVIMTVTGWYNTNTAAGKRAVKDYKTNINNGIEREIIITAEDGREIFRYDGKIDIESNHEDNYIKFDDERGKRYIIYYGIQDTITIIEK